jgi:hypothetical protein
MLSVFSFSDKSLSYLQKCQAPLPRWAIPSQCQNIRADISVGKNKLDLGWAKVWEGYDGLSDKTDQAPDSKRA